MPIVTLMRPNTLGTTKQKKNNGDEAAEEVEEGEMPLSSYLIAHPEARFSKEEKAQLIEGLKKTFGEKKEHDEEEHEH